MSRFEVEAPEGIGEVETGTDLVGLVAGALPDLADGDVVVVTSKVVSKAEGRVAPGTRDDALPGETVRLVARRGGTRIVTTRHGLVLAAAGIDASNVVPGTVLLLHEDPDATARAIRAGLAERSGRNVAVLVSDTAGRAWRQGQTDIAIGAAGLVVLDDHAGRVDGYGNALAVTAPAIADEITGAAELASGKLGGRPLVRVRGLAEQVLPVGEDGPGAAALVRPLAEDLFALGAREAVLAALAGRDPAAYGPAVPAEELVAELTALGLSALLEHGTVTAAVGDAGERTRLALASYALGWTVADAPGTGRARLRPRTP